MSWCQEKDLCLGVIGYAWQNRDWPRRVRCKNCGKNFLTFVRDCHDPGCRHYYLPKHKVKVRKPKKKTKHERKVR